MSQPNDEIVLEDHRYSCTVQLKCPPACTTPTCGRCGQSNYIHDRDALTKIKRSSEFSIGDKISFQAMFIGTKSGYDCLVKFQRKYENDKRDYQVFLSFTNQPNPNNQTHTNQIIISNKQFSVDSLWHSVTETLQAGKSYIITLKIMLEPLGVPYKGIIEDTTYTDLELRGIDGSVHMHRVVAEACSPWFKTLFSGPWTETDNGIVNVENTTVATLRHLKDYMYLGKVPEFDGLKELIVLSSFYLMEDLERRCAFELSRTITTENAFDLIELAVKHNMGRLLFEILHIVQSKQVDVYQMEKLHKM